MQEPRLPPLRVLVLGGCGNCGRIICRRLRDIENVELVIGGRSMERTQAFAHELGAQALGLDAHAPDLAARLEGALIDLVISTAGPFRQQNYGVHIASTRALMSEPDTEAYAASKGGIVALTRSLAVSLGPDVRVNCISPGWIDVYGWKRKHAGKKSKLSAADHNQHPGGRVGKPEDIASLILYLASPASGFITGANFIVDGGMTRKMIYV